MNTKDYIASGILEEYALGLVSDQERREVECLSKIYPEILESLHVIDDELHSFASAYARPVPDGLKAKILDSLRDLKREQSLINNPGEESIQPEPNEAKVIGIGTKGGGGSSWSGWAAAAAVIALIFGVWQYSEKADAEEELLAQAEQQQQMDAELSQMEQTIAQLSEGLNEVYNPDVRKVVLKSPVEGDDTQLALLWNTSSGQVKLSTDNLPSLNADEQYQLWVLTDGVPADMGVLPKNPESLLIASKNTKEGDTFAITIETLGGNPAPNLERLVLIGEVG